MLISNTFFLVGGKMSLCGGADGYVLVHRGPSSGCHRDAPGLPLPNTGNSSIQEIMPSVLPRNQFSLPQWSCDGLVHRGVGPPSQNSPEGPHHRRSETSVVRRPFCLFVCSWDERNHAELILLIRIICVAKACYPISLPLGDMLSYKDENGRCSLFWDNRIAADNEQCPTVLLNFIAL